MEPKRLLSLFPRHPRKVDRYILYIYPSTSLLPYPDPQQIVLQRKIGMLTFHLSIVFYHSVPTTRAKPAVDEDAELAALEASMA